MVRCVYRGCTIILRPYGSDVPPPQLFQLLDYSTVSFRELQPRWTRARRKRSLSLYPCIRAFSRWRSSSPGARRVRRRPLRGSRRQSCKFKCTCARLRQPHYKQQPPHAPLQPQTARGKQAGIRTLDVCPWPRVDGEMSTRTTREGGRK